jgi:hypothetical protein
MGEGIRGKAYERTSIPHSTLGGVYARLTHPSSGRYHQRSSGRQIGGGRAYTMPRGSNDENVKKGEGIYNDRTSSQTSLIASLAFATTRNGKAGAAVGEGLFHTTPRGRGGET